MRLPSADVALPLAAPPVGELGVVLPEAASRRVIGGALGKVAPLDVLHEVLDHRLVVEALPGLEDLLHARVRLRAARHEERAAVRSGLAGDVVGPDLMRAGDDLLLVRSDERTKHGHLHGLVDGGDVLQRLGGHLAE